MSATRNEPLFAQCEAQLPAFIETWKSLVNIDSGTGYGPGLTAVGKHVLGFLDKIGVPYKTQQVKGGNEGFHIVATLKGTGRGKVLAMAHMDTVFAEGTAAERPFRIDGDWVYGPGVSDCKGSVTACLYTLKILKDLNVTAFDTVTCLFNADEETGSPDSRFLIQQLAKEHDVVLCCEPGQEGDGVVLSRKGSALMNVEVRGKASHAGNAPKQGCNALIELMHQISKLSQLEDGSPMSLNFTVARAGDRTNVIPDHAMAQADIRITEPTQLERLERESARIGQERLVPDTEVTITITSDNPPFPANARTDALIDQAQLIYGELGKTLKTSHTGGASDANWAAATGATVVDGLGPVKGGINHTVSERTALSSVVPRLYLLARLFCEAGKK